jgi:hypothetical protein
MQNNPSLYATVMGDLETKAQLSDVDAQLDSKRWRIQYAC